MFIVLQFVCDVMRGYLTVTGTNIVTDIDMTHDSKYGHTGLSFAFFWHVL